MAAGKRRAGRCEQRIHASGSAVRPRPWAGGMGRQGLVGRHGGAETHWEAAALLRPKRLPIKPPQTTADLLSCFSNSYYRVVTVRQTPGRFVLVARFVGAGRSSDGSTSPHPFTLGIVLGAAGSLLGLARARRLLSLLQLHARGCVHRLNTDADVRFLILPGGAVGGHCGFGRRRRPADRHAYNGAPPAWQHPPLVNLPLAWGWFLSGDRPVAKVRFMGTFAVGNG